MSSDTPKDHKFLVIVNDEGQYSIWTTTRAIPDGWRDVGQTGTKADCLAYIRRVWTDMRPRSIRNAIRQQLRT